MVGTIEMVIESNDILIVFDQASNFWIKNGYYSKYQEALESSGFFNNDALLESQNIALVMQKDILEGYFVNTTTFSSLEALDIKISKYNQKVACPAIFVLGSGNIGIPLILNIIVGVMTRKHVYARASQANKNAINVWLASLRDPQLRLSLIEMGLTNSLDYVINNIELIDMPHTDPSYAHILSELPIQQSYLWGGADALLTTANMIQESVNTHLFGPRTGVFVIEYEWWVQQSIPERRRIAQSLYDNIMIFDAALCQSPTLGFIIGSKEEANKLMQELVNYIVPHPTEYDRLKRLDGANLYRILMNSWLIYGYEIHSAKNTNVTFAVGDLSAHKTKEHVSSNRTSYHNSASSMEMLVVSEQDAANLISNIQNISRYEGLWSVGHLLVAAHDTTIKSLIIDIDNKLTKDPLILKASSYRVVDIRNNFGRIPGESFDGINLVNSMFK